MKIAWLTPFCKYSAIGDFSRIITNLLAEQIDVHLWSPKADIYHATQLPHFCLNEDEQPWSKLSEYDFVIANFGDNFLFHREIYFASLHHPVVAILHDIVGHHFFTGLHFLNCYYPEKHIAMVERYYGLQGRKIIEQSLEGYHPHVWDTEEVLRYPLFEPFVENAIGAVVHSKFYKSILSENYHGPILTNYLPHFFEKNDHSITITRKQLGLKDHEKLIVTIGVINENKRIDATLKAIASDERLRNSIRMIVIGACRDYYFNNLMPLVNGLNLTANVNFLNYVPDETLDRYLAGADLAINLRRPVMEGGSASLTRLMYYNLPIIVNNQGVYSEFPDDILMKVSPFDEVNGIRQILNLLLDSPQTLKIMGQRAGEYVRNHLTPEVYADALMKFLPTLDTKQNSFLMQLKQTINSQIQSIKANKVKKLVTHVELEMNTLFNPNLGKAEW